MECAGAIYEVGIDRFFGGGEKNFQINHIVSRGILLELFSPRRMTSDHQKQFFVSNGFKFQIEREAWMINDYQITAAFFNQAYQLLRRTFP